MNPETQNPLPVFAGTVNRVVDESHRITVPASWRHPDLSELYAMPDPRQPSLVLMVAGEMEKIRVAVESDPSIPRLEARAFVRQLYAAARPCAMDRQGRLVLPAEECGRLGLSGEVVIVGGGSRIEIWTQEEWAKVAERERSVLTEIADRIGF
jgi:MraZ protein